MFPDFFSVPVHGSYLFWKRDASGKKKKKQGAAMAAISGHFRRPLDPKRKTPPKWQVSPKWRYPQNGVCCGTFHRSKWITGGTPISENLPNVLKKEKHGTFKRRKRWPGHMLIRVIANNSRLRNHRRAAIGIWNTLERHQIPEVQVLQFQVPTCYDKVEAKT